MSDTSGRYFYHDHNNTLYNTNIITQKYVHPWLFGITTPTTKSPQEVLMETCNAILSSVDLLKKSMVSLESSLDRHSNKLDEVSQNMLEVRMTEESFKYKIFYSSSSDFFLRRLLYEGHQVRGSVCEGNLAEQVNLLNSLQATGRQYD